MHGFALVSLGLMLAMGTDELQRDVVEIGTRRFAIPLCIDADRKDEMQRVRLFVSADEGKSWKHKQDYNPREERMIFTAEHDGLYWFALQVVGKDGKSEPAKLHDLAPRLKVYVNTGRKVLKRQEPCEELRREINELHKTVERLQKRVKELESDRKH